MKGTDKKATTTTNKSRQLQHQRMRRRELSVLSGAGGQLGWEGWAEQQRQTWLSVSPFIHQHLKLGTKQLSSVCWDCPFIPLTAVVYKNTKVTCVFLLVSVNSREAWFGWMKRGSKFLHFTEAYIIFLLPVKQNVFSTGSLVLVMVKKTKKKTRVRNKKSSGPKHDDADSATSPPSR